MKTAGGRPPVILSTENKIGGEGGSTEYTFGVSAYGLSGDILTYRWQYYKGEWYDEKDRNDSELIVIGAKSSSIRIFIVSNEMYLLPKYRCIITDQNGNEVIQEFIP